MTPRRLRLVSAIAEQAPPIPDLHWFSGNINQLAQVQAWPHRVEFPRFTEGRGSSLRWVASEQAWYGTGVAP